MSKDIREELKAYYLDYLNNYISVRIWAQDNNLGLLDGTVIIELGKRLHEEDALRVERDGTPKDDELNMLNIIEYEDMDFGNTNIVNIDSYNQY